MSVVRSAFPFFRRCSLSGAITASSSVTCTVRSPLVFVAHGHLLQGCRRADQPWRPHGPTEGTLREIRADLLARAAIPLVRPLSSDQCARHDRVWSSAGGVIPVVGRKAYPEGAGSDS